MSLTVEYKQVFDYAYKEIICRFNTCHYMPWFSFDDLPFTTCGMFQEEEDHEKIKKNSSHTFTP